VAKEVAAIGDEPVIVGGDVDPNAAVHQEEPEPDASDKKEAKEAIIEGTTK
jgi:hypothetical protein